MRSLHSFTLTPRAAEIVAAWKKGTKSGKVSACIIKYGNDYRLNPEGVRYWQETVAFLQEEIKERNQLISAATENTDYNDASNGGVKHHLACIWRILLKKKT
jgi:hypothetical protein